MKLRRFLSKGLQMLRTQMLHLRSNRGLTIILATSTSLSPPLMNMRDKKRMFLLLVKNKVVHSYINFTFCMVQKCDSNKLENTKNVSVFVPHFQYA